MKQLKFKEDIIIDNIIVWHKDIIYQVSFENEDVYALVCEDMNIRGIEKSMENTLFEVLING